jgi:hypothetical protein
VHVKEVYAAFEHQDHEPFEIMLKGLPEEAEPPSERSRFSRVALSAIVPSDAPPGLYRSQRLGVLFTGSAGYRSIPAPKRRGRSGSSGCAKSQKHLQRFRAALADDVRGISKRVQVFISSHVGLRHRALSGVHIRNLPDCLAALP